MRFDLSKNCCHIQKLLSYPKMSVDSIVYGVGILSVDDGVLEKKVPVTIGESNKVHVRRIKKIKKHKTKLFNAASRQMLQLVIIDGTGDILNLRVKHIAIHKSKLYTNIRDFMKKYDPYYEESSFNGCGETPLNLFRQAEFKQKLSISENESVHGSLMFSFLHALVVNFEAFQPITIVSMINDYK
jgi:hypothetical protein